MNNKIFTFILIFLIIGLLIYQIIIRKNNNCENLDMPSIDNQNIELKKDIKGDVKDINKELKKEHIPEANDNKTHYAPHEKIPDNEIDINKIHSKNHDTQINCSDYVNQKNCNNTQGKCKWCNEDISSNCIPSNLECG